MKEYLAKAWRFNLKLIQRCYLKIHVFNILDIFAKLSTWILLITEWIFEQKSAANLSNETYTA